VHTWQRSLFELGDEVGLGPLDDSTRSELGDGAWVALNRGWVSRQDLLFERLDDRVPWRLERRTMYDQVVDVPRMLAFYDEGDKLPDPLLAEARRAIDLWTGGRSGGPLSTTGICLYRHGGDSVAWHGDRIGREGGHQTLVAIVSLGARRRFLMRPRSGGLPLRFDLGSGDLLVMGGTCQQTWEHCVPKTSKPIGPRISVQFRTRG
jgi:alkylated DNA repair dioxygenase AlkB